ncbi:hypothetical protein L7F22_022654 [Adiantum nelumboides]|nr:hypothetical protein [Adiantum nelumboides]
MMSIPKVEEPWPQSLWETVRNRKDGSATLQSAPIPEIHLDNDFYPGDIQLLYGDAGTDISMKSKLQSLETLPSFISEHKNKLEVRMVPSQIKAIPKIMDTKSLHKMLSTPITCIITLSELLKIKPHLWEEMGKHLEVKGMKIPHQENPILELKYQGNQPRAQSVPINKVGDYCEGEEDNTTLPVEYQGIKIVAMLDSGTGVAIATEQIWEKRGFLVNFWLETAELFRFRFVSSSDSADLVHWLVSGQEWFVSGLDSGLVSLWSGSDSELVSLCPDEGKIKVILELPPPHNYKGVQRFMGHVGYYRRFILLFAEIARPLYKLLIEFKWTEDCDQAYEVLKKALASAPILRALDWNVIFHVHIDASNFAIGCVLTQPREHKLDYPISFASRQLNDAEKNYTTTEREGLAMIYSVKKF